MDQLFIWANQTNFISLCAPNKKINILLSEQMFWEGEVYNSFLRQKIKAHKVD